MPAQRPAFDVAHAARLKSARAATLRDRAPPHRALCVRVRRCRRPLVLAYNGFMADEPVKQRESYYDNFKFLLITLVVIGHVITFSAGVFAPLKAVYSWIYMFHMPAFVFVSGMFAKNIYTRERGLRVSTLLFYLIMFVLFYFALWGWSHICYDAPEFKMLFPGSIQWYFLAMALWGLTVPLVSRAPGGLKLVIPISVVLALAVGFVDYEHDFLTIGRTIAFAPFYYLGYFLSIKGFSGWVSSMRQRKWPIVLAVVILVGVFVFELLGPPFVTGAFPGLLPGRSPYLVYEAFPLWGAMLMRLLAMFLALVMGTAFAILVPTGRTFFTDMGSRTLQVYVLHAFVYYLFDGFGLHNAIVPYLPWAAWGLIVLAIGLTFLLAAPKFPEKAMRRLRKALTRLDRPARTASA